MKTKIISLLLLIMLTLTAISCNQEVIFYDIAREVKLVDPEINGNIFSIVPLAGKLYVQNGSIYEKNNVAVAHGWTLIAKPEDSQNIIRLASDATCLYAMDEARTVWAKTGSDTTWTKIAEDVKELFDNQIKDASCGTTGRTAYITCSDNSVKQLSGTANPAAVTVQDVIASTDEDAYIKTAASDGTTTFFSSNAAFCISGTTLYTVKNSSKVIKYMTQGGSWTDGGSVSDTPTCICTYRTSEGVDELLIGTANGYEISTIDATTKAPSNGANSSTNAESLIGNKRRITVIQSFGTSVYAGVINDSSSQYSKLWGWFGESWNYE